MMKVRGQLRRMLRVVAHAVIATLVFSALIPTGAAVAAIVSEPADDLLAAGLLTAVVTAPTTDYIVVFENGTNASAKAKSYGVKPAFVYRYALSGFAAPLTDAQRGRIQRDPDTIIVALNDPEAPRTAKKGATAIEQLVPQQVARGVRRIGGLESPTAKIDGVDERVPVDVAVLDSGIQVDHPDLNVKGGVSCIGGRGFDDLSGHGTMVAGIIGALDNGFGVVGVAPGARLWSVRVLDAETSGTRANLLCGIDWVTQHSDVIEIANMSFGERGGDDGACGRKNQDPVHWAICNSVAAGVTYVAAAGNVNEDSSNWTPASYDEVITVSGHSDSDGMPGGAGPATCDGDADDVFASFSNFGVDVDIAAPSVCVGSTYVGSTIAVNSGTSFAAPHVAGAAALFLATHPHATPKAVRNAIRDARERGHLQGDPDSQNEGLLNVSGF